MDTASKTDAFRAWLVYGLGGLTGGVCLALCVTIGLLAQRATYLASAPAQAITPHPAMTPTALPTVTPPAPFVTPIPSVEIDPVQADLALAERYLAESQPEKVIELLLARLDQLTRPDDLARAYDYLGQAEMQLGHFQLAAGYFEKLYAYQPTAENLFMLATAYDLGGDLERALEKYLALLGLGDTVPPDMRATVEQRIQDLRDVLGTPTPASA
jgi:hypothetical protein